MPFLPPNQQRQSTEGKTLIFDKVIQRIKNGRSGTWSTSRRGIVIGGVWPMNNSGPVSTGMSVGKDNGKVN